ncbi:uncharacterized protein EHS24_006948 [Apiotrichum porosum]|uniref:Uncharacterized protein n=1 Tax=Apiotrichum porosum TaxID=105984 RepID=A0A427XWP6_9TREE|nr:uncharacterized protein EHS24_006948 [Apiotrichum porosum]RSH83274.1 hypothetical protein EHS24_006948 [Apiotrichum porosum]
MKRDCPPLFHYTQTVTATGQAAPQPWQRVIDPIWCDAGIGSTCNIAKGNQITTSESLNIGIDGGPSADDVAGEALKGINANAGFSLGTHGARATPQQMPRAVISHRLPARLTLTAEPFSSRQTWLGQLSTSTNKVTFVQ